MEDMREELKTEVEKFGPRGRGQPYPKGLLEKAERQGHDDQHERRLFAVPSAVREPKPKKAARKRKRA